MGLEAMIGSLGSVAGKISGARAASRSTGGYGSKSASKSGGIRELKTAGRSAGGGRRRRRRMRRRGSEGMKKKGGGLSGASRRINRRRGSVGRVAKGSIGTMLGGAFKRK